jgi:hypothetical protein
MLVPGDLIAPGAIPAPFRARVGFGQGIDMAGEIDRCGRYPYPYGITVENVAVALPA